MDWGSVEEAIRGVDPAIEAADQTLMDTAVLLERARCAIDAAQLGVLAELDVRGSTDVAEGLTTKRWLAREVGLPVGAAGRQVTVARSLRLDLPGTGNAVRDGVIGFEHARVMADAINDRIAPEFRELEAELIAMAEGMVFEEWRTHVRSVACLLDQDGSYDPDGDFHNNRLSLRPSPAGTEIAATLVGGTAATVSEAIEEMAAELYRDWEHDAQVTGNEIEVPSWATLRALALAELCRRARSIDIDRSTPPRVEATVVLHLDRPDQVYDRNNVVHTRRGIFDAMLCDADIALAVLDSLGRPLDVGRAERYFTRDQRRALARRDGGCVFPGCGAQPHRCDAHHIQHYADGGHTDIAAGVLLCRRHHGVVHRTGWAITIGDDGWAWITTPTGTNLWAQHHHRTREGPPPPTRRKGDGDGYGFAV